MMTFTKIKKRVRRENCPKTAPNTGYTLRSVLASCGRCSAAPLYTMENEPTQRRRIKDGTIQGAKIGRQYRFMGVDLINSVRKRYKRYIIR